MARKRRKEQLLLRVTPDGTFAPADGISAGRCRERGYHVGLELLAELKKPRHPGQWRCAHRLAKLIQQNSDDFDHCHDHHAVLKKLQLDARVACDLVEAVTEDGEVVRVYWPQSLAFDQMEQGEFEAVYKLLCQHVADSYFPGCSDEDVADMAEMMSRQVA